MIVRVQPALFQTAHAEWPTPQAFFDELDAEFGFTVDVAATAENSKCGRFYSIEEDGLSQAWEGVVWCNPPYGREIAAWIRKGYESSLGGATVVMLLPVRTSAPYFHDYCLKGEVRFVKGRLSFGMSRREGGGNAPFDSMVVIFRGQVNS